MQIVLNGMPVSEKEFQATAKELIGPVAKHLNNQQLAKHLQQQGHTVEFKQSTINL